MSSAQQKEHLNQLKYLPKLQVGSAKALHKISQNRSLLIYGEFLASLASLALVIESQNTIVYWTYFVTKQLSRCHFITFLLTGLHFDHHQWCARWQAQLPTNNHCCRFTTLHAATPYCADSSWTNAAWWALPNAVHLRENLLLFLLFLLLLYNYHRWVSQEWTQPSAALTDTAMGGVYSCLWGVRMRGVGKRRFAT